MNTTLVYEYYDEEGKWIDEKKLGFKESEMSLYLGDLSDKILDHFVNGLKSSSKRIQVGKYYKSKNIELVDIHQYVEYRSNVALIFIQHKIRFNHMK